MKRKKIKAEKFKEKAMDDIRQNSYYSGNIQAQAGKYSINEIDPNTKIQTGYGMPTWNWNKIKFSRNGPVKMD